jgi:hypothetical protein
VESDDSQGTLQEASTHQQCVQDVTTQNEIPARQAIKEIHNQKMLSKRYQKTMKPALKLPQVSTVQEEDEDAVLTEEAQSTGNSTAKRSDALPRLQPFQNVPVNDGTHRLTVRWKPTGGVQQYENDKPRLNTAIQTLLSSMLDDDDGLLYRWECEDLQVSTFISKMTGVTIRDYISPTISFTKATSQIIICIRVGFTENPIKWQNADNKKQTLRDNNVEIKISNSSSSGGRTRSTLPSVQTN